MFHGSSVVVVVEHQRVGDGLSRPRKPFNPQRPRQVWRPDGRVLGSQAWRLDRAEGFKRRDSRRDWTSMRRMADLSRDLSFHRDGSCRVIRSPSVPVVHTIRLRMGGTCVPVGADLTQIGLGCDACLVSGQKSWCERPHASSSIQPCFGATARGTRPIILLLFTTERYSKQSDRSKVRKRIGTV